MEMEEAHGSTGAPNAGCSGQVGQKNGAGSGGIKILKVWLIVRDRTDLLVKSSTSVFVLAG